MRRIRAIDVGRILIVAVFMLGMLASLAGLAAPESEHESAPSVDASQLGPAANQTTAAAQADSDDKVPEADGQDEQEQEDAAAQVILPSGPQTQLPAGNATLSQLLRLWGVFGDQVASSCRALHVGNLRCLSGRGDLDLLVQFNLPALLLLVHDGHKRRVLLTELGTDEAVVVGAKGARRMARDLLARLWTGRFEVIWRSMAGTALIRQGMRGKAVAWLQQKLRLEGDAAEAEQQGEPASVVFGESMEAQVRHFQLMHGLEPDGLVGPRTQIMLNGLTPDTSIPALTPKQKSGK